MLKLTVTCDVCNKEETIVANAMNKLTISGWETHNYDSNREDAQLPEHHICPLCAKNFRPYLCLPTVYLDEMARVQKRTDDEVLRYFEWYQTLARGNQEKKVNDGGKQ